MLTTSLRALPTKTVQFFDRDKIIWKLQLNMPGWEDHSVERFCREFGLDTPLPYSSILRHVGLQQCLWSLSLAGETEKELIRSWLSRCIMVGLDTLGYSEEESQKMYEAMLLLKPLFRGGFHWEISPKHCLGFWVLRAFCSLLRFEITGQFMEAWFGFNSIVLMSHNTAGDKESVALGKTLENLLLSRLEETDNEVGSPLILDCRDQSKDTL